MENIKILDDKVYYEFIQDLKDIHPAVLQQLKEKGKNSNNQEINDSRRRGGIIMTQNDINEQKFSNLNIFNLEINSNNVDKLLEN